ncbi:unnamed protein product [Miscanthus lutarioriparius]|uniref:C2H2-type domain-containing protein n=1 Tax=Miscanthus lutarioriparius TaxID=422564 RepID=A0A811P6Z1_9POAL|nr:unnamed protein product [Miscanthus lutarioriparius]
MEFWGNHFALSPRYYYPRLLSAIRGSVSQPLLPSGKEVKPGATVSCEVGDDLVIHLSQVYAPYPYSSDEELETDQIPKISATKVPVKGGIKVESSSSDDDDDDFTGSESDSEMSDEDDSSDEDEVSSGADPSDDSDSDEQTPTPKKTDVVVGKKRAIEGEALSGKKAKSEQSAQKTGDKVSTHSAKQSSKTPADKSTKTPTADKKSPKSGSHACKSCNKSFGSASALESHQKAKKHEA